MMVHAQWRPPVAVHSLVEHGGRTFRIPNDSTIVGALDLDESHALIVMERRAPPRGPNPWPRAITLRICREAGTVWVSGLSSVTLPVDQIGALISALFDAQGEAR